MNKEIIGKTSKKQLELWAYVLDNLPFDWIGKTILNLRITTIRRMETEEWIHYFPYGGARKQGVWKITPSGRDVLLLYRSVRVEKSNP